MPAARTARIEIEAKQYQIRFYDTHADDYTAACSLFKEGERAILYSMVGPGFYRQFAGLAEQLLRELGITVVQAHVTRAHARLLRRVLGKRLHIEEHPAPASGRDLVLVEIRDREDPCPAP